MREIIQSFFLLSFYFIKVFVYIVFEGRFKSLCDASVAQLQIELEK